MTLLLPSLLVVLSLVLLWIGAEGLVRGASSLALRLGLSPLVVGLTIVAAGTSMPELLVCVRATLVGQGNLALGNAIGSNLFNTGVILGIGALLQPLHVRLQLVKFDTPALIAVTALFLFFFRNDTIGRLEGGLLLGLLILWTWVNLVLARREGTVVQAEFAEALPPPKGTIGKDLLFLVVGLGVLVWGSELLVDNAILIARSVGVSEAVIGLTIVAAGTSMPELATTVVAAARKEADLAIGNVIGSNLFNLLGIVGTSALVAPLVGVGIKDLDLIALAVFTVLLFPLMRTGFIVRRWEGLLLLGLYGAYLSQQWPK